MSAYSSLVLGTSGLVSYWRLGESSGSVVDSQNAHNGTVTSATYGETGLLVGDADKALLFDADGDKVVIADHTDYAVSTGLSIEAWIRLDASTSGQVVFGRRTAAGAGGFSLQTGSAGNMDLLCTLNGAGGQAISGSGFTTGTTIHVVATFNGAFLRVYRNGAQVSVDGQDWTGFPIVNPASPVVEIGHESWNANQSFRGVIDEVAIYNVALSPTTIAAHYALGHNGPGSVRLAQQFQLRPY